MKPEFGPGSGAKPVSLTDSARSLEERPAQPLAVLAEDPSSMARAGVLTTAHGQIRTPAFVPLATKATIKTLLPQEVSDLGFDIVLGNTFHLHLNPTDELIAQAGGLHKFMGWDGPIITDSGGFQVFSMGHGTVADEIKGRRSASKNADAKGGGQLPHDAQRRGQILKIEENGVKFRSYLDGATKYLTPEKSMEIQANLGSDLAVVFDECTPFHVEREYTARSTERTHRWLDRCLAWHGDNAPGWQLVYGIIQGGIYEDLRIEAVDRVGSTCCDGIAIGGSLGADKEQMYQVTEWTTKRLQQVVPLRPRHLLGIGDIDDLIRGVELGIDTFDCAMPTRLGRHGVAVVASPEKRWREDLTRAKFKHSQEPICEGCTCPACSHGFTRGYLRYLLKSNEHLGGRLLTLHNLAFVQNVMYDLRQGILNGNLAEVAKQLRAGAMPQGVQA